MLKNLALQTYDWQTTQILKKILTFFRFGVCCVFKVSAATGTINKNNTYVQNPSFPKVYSGTDSTLSYKIAKASLSKNDFLAYKQFWYLATLFCTHLQKDLKNWYHENCTKNNFVFSDICYLRLDFETFTIIGTADIAETDGGGCTKDAFKITVVTQSHLYQGRMSGRTLFLLACMVWLAQSCQSCPMTQMDEKSSRPCMTSLDECMQARITHAHLFYLGIDDFGLTTALILLYISFYLSALRSIR